MFDLQTCRVRCARGAVSRRPVPLDGGEPDEITHPACRVRTRRARRPGRKRGRRCAIATRCSVSDASLPGPVTAGAGARGRPDVAHVPRRQARRDDSGRTPRRLAVRRGRQPARIGPERRRLHALREQPRRLGRHVRRLPARRHRHPARRPDHLRGRRSARPQQRQRGHDLPPQHRARSHPRPGTGAADRRATAEEVPARVSTGTSGPVCAWPATTAGAGPTNRSARRPTSSRR